MQPICPMKDQRDRGKTPDLADVYYKLSSAESQLRSGVSLLTGEDVFGKLREKQRTRRSNNL
jgi:hypothetical protein